MKLLSICISNMVRLLGRAPEYVPDWSKPVLKHFLGVYSKVYKRCYSSIKEEKLIKTPMGPWIYVNYWDHVEREIANGAYERRYMDIFCSKVKEGDVVVDVGAYVGIFSLLAAERVGSTGCVYAFEPVSRNYERLMRNLKLNQAENVKAYNFGLSDKNETLHFNVPRENPAEATLYESAVSEISKSIKMQKDVVESSLKPFDQFYMEEGLNKVDIVKIDVEGAELKVLKGMENILKSNDLMLFIEIFPPLIEHIGGSVGELITLLANCGFKNIYSVKSDRYLYLGINVKNVNEIVEFIREWGYNFILSKSEGEIKW